MTRRDLVTCFHEPFGDAFYYGPEKISRAWLRWPAYKIERSGRAQYTYDYVLQNVLAAIKEPNKRVFLKDMSYHIIPPSHSPNAIAPSLHHCSGPKDLPNPTLLPTTILHNFQFVFLIRNPSASIPSLYRCFLPPLSEKTEEHVLDSSELGYRETRTLFDYLYPFASRSDDNILHKSPILIDADDLLSHPDSILRLVCSRLDIPYSPSMLSWYTPEDQAYAKSLFEKYAGYHEDALHSTGLRPKPVEPGEKARTRPEEDEEWTVRYGSDAAGQIREAVNSCREDYEYLREFRIRPEESRDEGLKGAENDAQESEDGRTG